MTHERLVLTTDTADPRVAVVELARPPVNAFDERFQRELISVAAELGSSSGLHAVVVHGGERFGAGDDIKEMHAGTAAAGAAGLALISEACTAFAALPVPTIAAVRGFALGGGCELALACDLRVSSPEARWGLPEVHLGLIPAGGGTQRLTRLVGPGRAKRMILLGEPVDGAAAYAMGLVDELAPDAEVLPTALGLARALAARAPLAVRAAKRAVDAALELDLAEGLALETRAAVELFGTEDARAAMAAFVERRPRDS
jgi:enoyl-CoA hydratase/carnithine racemase